MIGGITSSTLERDLQEEFNRIEIKESSSERNTSFVFSNDDNMAGVLDEVKKLFSNEANYENKAGMVVGTGGLMSICPEMPFETWFVFDKNKFILEWMAYNIEAIRCEPNLKDYTRRVIKDNFLESVNNTEIHFNKEIESLGRYHYMAGEERFSVVQDKLKKSTIVLCEGDLMNLEYTHAVGRILEKRKLDISFANMTNLFQHCVGRDDVKNPEDAKQKFIQSLFNIFSDYEKKIPIIWSHFELDETMTSEVAIGFKQYFGIANYSVNAF
ncbi:hypothetical protein HYU07_06390 [Candidatus Woesearchaeota archaeon]|nr:hypothetical protein [Candidatus Woesearchaeota archaeon]